MPWTETATAWLDSEEGRVANCVPTHVEELKMAPPITGMHICTPGSHELVGIDATRRICGCPNCVAYRDRDEPAPKRQPITSG